MHKALGWGYNMDRVCIRCGGENEVRGRRRDWWLCKDCGLMVKPYGVMEVCETCIHMPQNEGGIMVGGSILGGCEHRKWLKEHGEIRGSCWEPNGYLWVEDEK